MKALDRFLFESGNAQILPVMRIGFAILILIQSLVLLPDVAYWFSDQGVLTTQSARRLAGTQKWSIFFLVEGDVWLGYFGVISLFVHGLLLGLGVYSRVQLAAIFLWLVSFQHRMPLIHDGEDTVFRLFAFFLMFLPLDASYSLMGFLRGKPNEQVADEQLWGLRLIQIEMTAIYASTFLSKLAGETWQNGTAMWYVSRMNDNYGRLIPSEWFDSHWMSQIGSYGTLVIEAFLPIGLWIPRLRWIAILLGVVLHLGIEMSMNLFLFEWVMILGLLSFVPRLKPRTVATHRQTVEGD
jgi:hypothetical protein